MNALLDSHRTRLPLTHRAPPAGAIAGIAGWLMLLVQIVAGALAIGLALATALVLLLVVAGQQAHASERGAMHERGAVDERGAIGAARHGAATDIERLNSHAAGGLLLETPQGLQVAPLQSSHAHLKVTGNTVRAVVTQRFRNPWPASEGRWIEGTWLFPLPDDAAVDRLRMRIGDRVVEGEIHEKQQARQILAKARAAGQQVSLVEQQRPNAFRTHVANIAPGAAIEIEIEYQQGLALKDGRWTLLFPTVLTPRYGRDPALLAWASDELPALAATTIADPDMQQPVVIGATDLNPVTMQIDIDAGLEVTKPISDTHQVLAQSTSSQQSSSARWSISTLGDTPADRDFALSWTPAPTQSPVASMRVERHTDGWYGLLVVNPPTGTLATQPRLPRETTFVIDTSGSMGGESIAQARRALLFALERLSPIDHFNVIQFNSVHSSLWTSPRSADARAIDEARAWVGRLQATGGTEMRGALLQALRDPLPEGRLGQVVFITDGAIDHEDELISLVRERIGARRLFTVGIGSAPNGWFMRKTAEIGHGTHTMIGRTGEIEARMAALFDRIARPVSSKLALDLEGAQVIDSPALPRELYAGEPLIATLKLSAMPTSAGVRGRHSDDWQVPVDLREAGDSGVHTLWARAQLEAIGDSLRRARSGGAGNDEAGRLRQQAVQLAISHHLVSDWTSLVAVDHTRVRPEGAPLDGGEVPANMPAGWSLPQTATPAALQLAIGIVLLALGFLLLLNRRTSQWIARLGQ